MGPESFKILALDDDAKFLAELKSALEPEFAVRTATDVHAAMKSIAQYRPDVLILDMKMPDISGLDVLKVMRQRMPDLPVLMLTGESSTELIVDAIKNGASDYIIKGSEDFFTRLKIAIGQTQVMNAIKRQNELLAAKVRESDNRYEMLGNSTSTIRLRADISRFKGTNAYVLICGENGTGKELVARNLNLQENDPSRPFVAVNCGAIPSNLFESELFGHVKGAFTGATVDQLGKFAAANGGDIFLDEIGELPLELQVKLLRVLQEKTFSPVGSNKVVRANVRVIAATNQNLEDLIAAGKFRQDLFYRINQIPLRTSSLRERKDDIAFLAQAFASKSAPNIKISKPAMKLLEEHSWPGNIRELENTIQRACLFMRGSGSIKIQPEHLQIAEIRATAQIAFPSGLIPNSNPDVTKDRYRECMDWMQKLFFERGLELLRGNNLELIARLGVSRTYYYDRKRELGIGAENDTRWM
jgi:two-component system response regulator AtoC